MNASYDLSSVYRRIQPLIRRTPILESDVLNERIGGELFFKCENVQHIGAFKFRGACAALSNIADEKIKNGVVTHSSGNHGQALAKAARMFGVPAYIVMPENAPLIKIEGVKRHHGEVYLCAPTLQAREEMASKIMEEKGATFIHPSNDVDVIRGQATVSMEFLEQVPELDQLICPVGGGGLLAGTCLGAHEFGKDVFVYAGEPRAADDAWRSLRSGQIEFNESPKTIADGLKTNLGSNNFPIIKKHVKGIIRVDEREILEAMELIWNELKIIVEPSSAVALAAVIKEAETFKMGKTGVILTGGNVNLEDFFLVLQEKI
jgi:threonine dehydratase